MSSNILTEMPEWAHLQNHKDDMENVHMRDLFATDPQRFEKFHITLPGLLFDYSKHKVTEATMETLLSLAKERDVESQRDALFAGETLNASENRPALHMTLRGSCAKDLKIGEEDVSDFVQGTFNTIEEISDNIRKNPTIKAVVNIGIGGSDLGPRMAYKALKPLTDGPSVFFISNMDGSALAQRLDTLQPENTIFIISSKSFTTEETLANANAAKTWLLKSLNPSDLKAHLFAVTENTQGAEDFGIAADHILPMRSWIGGRTSIWGAVGLPIAIACGHKIFKNFLDGAHAVDQHFLNMPFEKNVPVIMALLGIWYRNFWSYPAQSILPYSHNLREFPIYVQQLDMESNGKSVTLDGKAIEYPTGPIIFGEAGTNAQHTFMQLVHQSPEIIPADFIGFATPHHHYTSHHHKLLGNMLAQSKAMMEGCEDQSEPHRNCPGNRPSSTLIFDRLDGYHLGMLLALYEHKVFVQGIIWGINSFDQWGVELGKTNAKKINEAIENNKETDNIDSSTAGLLNHLKEKFIKS